MLKKLKTLLGMMKAEPSLSTAIPETYDSVKRTFSWMAVNEMLTVLSGLHILFLIDEVVKGPDARFWMFLLIGTGLYIVLEANLIAQSKMGINRNDVYWNSWRIWWSYGNRALLRQCIAWHNRNGTGEKESLVSKNIMRFQNLFDEVLFNTTPTTLRIAMVTIVLTFVKLPFGLHSLLVAIVFIVVLRKVEMILLVIRKDFQERIKEVEKFGAQLIALVRPIRSVGMEEEFADRNDLLLQRFAKDEHARHTIYEKCVRYQARVINLGRASFVVMLGVMICYFKDYSMSASLIAMVYDWKGRAESIYSRYFELQHQLGQGQQALTELVDFAHQESEIAEPDEPQWPLELRGEVTFTNVVFTHAGADEPTICGFDLNVPAFTAVALVGESGSGKSTIMNLVGRQHDVDGGTIRIDGLDIRQFDTRAYRSKVLAVVSQDVQLADSNIADNIRFGRPLASMEEVIEAARGAGAHEFIIGMKDGYETEVGEGGVRLSGGQKQRIAIARALIMKPTILVLDEATSALDAMSQAEVQKTIDELMAQKRCTIFIVAHRLSTVRKAHQIVVMDKGAISAIGDHASLLESSEVYKRMNEIEHL